MKIIYFDEAVFTFRRKTWSKKNKTIEVYESSVKAKTVALIAAISEDRGHFNCNQSQ